MQTISFLLFRLEESGLGSQDILSEKKKNMLESFLLVHAFSQCSGSGPKSRGMNKS